MTGRIVRPEQTAQLELPEIGRLHIGMKVKNQYGKEYPTSVDYFIPSGKYAALFTREMGEKPSTIAIIFPDDTPERVCNERFEYRNDRGELVARGDGSVFEVWDGKRYAPYSVEKYPDIMRQVAERNPKKKRNETDDGWDITLTLRFIVPAVRGVVGVWQFTTKGAASSINNIRNSFDGVQALRGTVRNTVFDLSVQFAKSNKPGVSSRYPVVSMVANDNRVEEISRMLKPESTTKSLLLSE
jgi:hypothetical protein|nr:MAG TPA: hypothetical protein [Caudoviricetes sp.]